MPFYIRSHDVLQACAYPGCGAQLVPEGKRKTCTYHAIAWKIMQQNRRNRARMERRVAKKEMK